MSVNFIFRFKMTKDEKWFQKLIIYMLKGLINDEMKIMMFFKNQLSISNSEKLARLFSKRYQTKNKNIFISVLKKYPYSLIKLYSL